ncbi:MAG: hypothetical protein EOP83_28125 [Verrucomicrobiaceae bacterium]|nr:MAG: hypothetical protein EOP83_28125 [Verrucomicrobiaceae bacterium]
MFACSWVRSKSSLNFGISRSFKHVMKPHMKNRAVTAEKAKRLLDRAGVVDCRENGVCSW